VIQNRSLDQVVLRKSFNDNKDKEATVYCAMAKKLASDTGFKICNECIQLHGGYGYTQEYPVERHMRDSRVHQILEGTNEIMRVIISRKVLEDGATEIFR
jgi:alkylation response protein AidB-like acyl-CoA dehydrogenase